MNSSRVFLSSFILVIAIVYLMLRGGGQGENIGELHLYNVVKQTAPENFFLIKSIPKYKVKKFLLAFLL